MKVNDILKSRWGYDQTNTDFYQVIKVTSKTATIREIAQEQVSTDNGWTGKATPILNKFIGEPVRKKIHICNNEELLKLESYAYARPWKGTPVNYSTYA